MVQLDASDVRYTIRVALERDLNHLYTFLVLEGEKTLLRRRFDELSEMIHDGHITLLESGGEIVGATYVAEGEGPDDWELGGGRVAPEHRAKGLFTWLGHVTLCNVLITLQPTGTIIGHVVQGNKGPLAAMKSMGFELKESKRYDPKTFPGLAEMPKDAEGFVVGETHVLPKHRYGDLLRAFLERASTDERITINIAGLSEKIVKEVLEDLPTGWEPAH